MKKFILIAFSSILITHVLFAQGPNRAFGKYKKLKKNTELICNDNCATILVAYPKGTYINSVKAALGIDDKYAVAVEKGTYIEFKIPAGQHKIILPQGVNDAGVQHEIEKCESSYENFIAYCSKFSNIANYTIHLGDDITDLKINLADQSYTNKPFIHQINYLSYNRDFKAGETYYFNTFVIGKGVSLACGPVLQETTKNDFELVKNGKKIKEKSEALYFKNEDL